MPQMRPESWRVLGVVPSLPDASENSFEFKAGYGVELLSQLNNLEFKLLRGPSLNELKVQLLEWQPNLLYIAGPYVPQPENQNDASLGPIHLATNSDPGMSERADEDVVAGIAAGLQLHAVYVDAAASSSQQGAASPWAAAADHVISWTRVTPPISALTASQFSHSFFAALANSSATIGEAYTIASHAVKTLCTMLADDKYISPDVPSLLPESPSSLPDNTTVPLPEIAGVDFSRGIENAIEGWSDVRLLAPRAELRLLLCGSTHLIDPNRLAFLGEALRAVLVMETRTLKVKHTSECDHVPTHLPPGCSAIRCDVVTTSGAHATVVLGGRQHILQVPDLVEHALRQTLVTDSLSLQFRLPPPSMPQPVARSSAAVAGGCPVVDTLVLTSVWAVQVLRTLAQDASFHGLIALGIAAVGGSPVAATDDHDVFRLHTLAAGVRPDLLPQPSGNSGADGAVVGGPSYDNGGPLPHSQPPLAAAAAAAHIAAPYSAVEQEGMSVDNGQRGVDQTVMPDQPSISRYMEAQGYRCQRPQMSSCGEEEFVNDLMKFSGIRRGKPVDPQRFPDAVLNGSTLDLYNLYREVTSRGGFRHEKGINWKGQVFPKMRNWTENHKMTGVGNALKRHYQNYLLEYEMCHPQDVTTDRCTLCGGNSDTGSDWIACDSCHAWQHFSCDPRTDIGSFKDYAQGENSVFQCNNCADGRSA